MRVDIYGAAAHTGLTVYGVRLAVKQKKFPVYRVGTGKLIFDTDLLDEAIKKEMLRSIENENEYFDKFKDK